MKRPVNRSISRLLILLLALSLAAAAMGMASVHEAPGSLDQNGADVETPSTAKLNLGQIRAMRVANTYLTNYHYRDVELNDELSERIFHSYLDMLDPNRSYFLAGDIEHLNQYRHGLDDAIRSHNVEPAESIFRLYEERLRERIAFTDELLANGFDFDIDESYRYDRSEADWAASEAELDDIWRKRVKNEWLRLKLTDKDPEGIRETLAERYANLADRVEELEDEDVFQYFMNAYAQSIEPHTNYFSPRTSENFEISMSLSLEGIGALLQRDSEYTSVARIVPGGPADLDGTLQPGDRIVGVGQGATEPGEEEKVVDVIGWRLDDVVDLIRGPKDSKVILRVLPEDAGLEALPADLTLVRDEVKLEEQAATSEIIEIPSPTGIESEATRVGVIDLPAFYIDFAGRAANRADYRSSTRDVAALIEELKAEGVDALVVDLRNNGGGSLLEATTLTGLFIDRGPVVQVQDSRGRVSLESDTDAGMAWSGPLAVMVNRYSASASEIFAAAIQDYGRGVVIGEPTFGKGTVQNLVDLGQMSRGEQKLGQLKMTMAQFFRVNGGSTQHQGVIPDIRFPSAGNAEEFGESALDFALPWTEIDAASFEASQDLEPWVGTLEQRHRQRVQTDQEFAFQLEDIEEYNSNTARTEVSLLESRRRAEMEEKDEKRKARAIARGESPDEETDATEIPDTEAVADVAMPGDTAVEEAAEDAEEREDFLLKEAARIASDLVHLQRGDSLAALEPPARTAADAAGG